MKKVQIPVLGGMRKVIQPGSNVTVGTTIAEIGAGSITLAQLAALITNIQAQQTNNGGGNIGSGSGGSISLGPGLSGGGPVVGNVPIRLIAPIPWGLDDEGGGGDGDPGPPGQAGPAGINGATGGVGPAGPAIYLEAEPGDDGLWAIPGPIGVQGPMGATGATGPQGPSGTGTGGGGGTLMFMVPEDNATDEELFRAIPGAVGPLVVNGPLTVNNSTFTLGGNQSNITTINFGTGTFPLATLAQISFTPQASGQLQLKAEAVAIYTGIGAGGPTQFFAVNAVGGISMTGNATINTTTGVALTVLNGATNGVQVNAGAGSNATYALLVSANAIQAMGVWGDGGVTVGTLAAVADKGPGTLNVQGQIYMRGAAIQNGQMMADETWTDEEIYRGPPSGALTVNGALSVQGATPPVVAGQTALGITTTATVITTIGGISLPALASTFWVVNINGVQFGIPCFAL